MSETRAGVKQKCRRSDNWIKILNFSAPVIFFIDISVVELYFFLYQMAEGLEASLSAMRRYRIMCRFIKLNEFTPGSWLTVQSVSDLVLLVGQKVFSHRSSDSHSRRWRHYVFGLAEIFIFIRDISRMRHWMFVWFLWNCPCKQEMNWFRFWSWCKR